MSKMQLVGEFFAAVEKHDFERVRRIYAPDAVIWHNDGQGEQQVEDNIAAVASVCDAVPDLHYDVLRRVETSDGGVLQLHVLRGSLTGGRDLALDAAMYIQTDGMSISRIDEYVDMTVVREAFGPT